MYKLCKLSLLLDVLIGFEHVNYSVRETIGQLMVNITVLDGNLTHPISVMVSTSDGTAISKYQTYIIRASNTGNNNWLLCFLPSAAYSRRFKCCHFNYHN